MSEQEKKPVTFVKRIDLVEESDYEGDEYRNSDSRSRDALDIVEQDGRYYLVRTKSYYSSSYDMYESPMHTSSQNCRLQICPIDEAMLGAQKEELLKYMDGQQSIWGRYDYDTMPTEVFVTGQVEKALKKHEEELEIARRKEKGECKPNAVFVSYSGESSPKYVHDFSTEKGLADALGCDAVNVTCREEVAFFQSKKVVFGLPLNRVASSILGGCLEGPVVVCGCKEGKCVPLTEEEVEELVHRFRVRKERLWP